MVALRTVTGDGMSDADLDAARARLTEELLLMGARVPPQDDASGAEAGPHATLDVTLVRVGPILQLQAQLRSPADELLLEVDRAVNADTLSRETLLGTEMAKAVRALWRPTAPPARDGADAGARAGPLEAQEASPPAAPLPAEERGASWWWLPVAGGLAAMAGSGALLAVVGLGLSLQQTFLAYTPTTAGPHKALALVIAPAALGAAGAGFGLLALGLGGGAAALAAFSLVGE